MSIQPHTLMIKVGFNIVNGLFLTMAIYFAIDMGYAFWVTKIETPPSMTIGSKPIVASSENDSPQPFAYYHPILGRNLFHSKPTAPPKEAAPKEIEIDSLNKTALKLKLWGTVATAGSASFAVIESEKERQQNLYRTGDVIEGASVKRILREKVVLTVKGKDEILEIEKPVGESAAARAASRTPMPESPVDAEPEVLPQGSGPAPKRRITLQRSQVESSLGNISQLMGDAKIEPNIADGNQDGLLISNVKPNSLFRRMGLRNGDVIVGVDGKAIESVDDGLKLYENLKKSDTASVEIKRRGQNQTIEFKIK